MARVYGALIRENVCLIRLYKVDTWTETSEEKEYAELSNMIADGITVEDPVMKTNEVIEVDKAGAAGGGSSKDQHDGRRSWTRRNANPDIPPLRHGKLRVVDPLVLFEVSKGMKPERTATAWVLRSEGNTLFAVSSADSLLSAVLESSFPVSLECVRFWT